LLKLRGKEFSSGMVEVTSFLEPLRAVFLAAFALLTLVCSDVLAEAGIAPPSENLHRATNNIVVAVVLDIDPAGAFLVAKQFDLFGQKK
jgi:hypothetical protein